METEQTKTEEKTIYDLKLHESLEAKFDINKSYFYEHSRPELKERTKKRLTEMAELGMNEYGIGSFGYENIISGLYIEKVWGYSDEKFKDYMDWVRKLIKTKNNNLK